MRRLGADRPEPHQRRFGGDRAGQYVVATERAPSDAARCGLGRGRVACSSQEHRRGPTQVTFTRIDTPSTPDRFVSGIAIDPADPNHAWVSYSGYGAYTPSDAGHVFEVTVQPRHQHSTWTDLSDNLGDQPVTGVAFNGATGDVYASTDFGVLRLRRAQPVGEGGAGLPRGDLRAHAAQSDGVLYAATHGRSAYVLKLPRP